MPTQAALGSDIAMAFDECPPADGPTELIRAPMTRTTRWAARRLEAPRAPEQLRFGIVQGGVDLDLRRAHLAETGALPFGGLAPGGPAAGAPPPVVADLGAPIAPANPP